MITTRENGPNGATITQHGHPIYLCYDEAPKVATDLVDLLLEHRAQESREYLLTLASHIENWYFVTEIEEADKTQAEVDADLGADAYKSEKNL